MNFKAFLLSTLLFFATATPIIADNEFFKTSSEENFYISDQEIEQEVEDATNILKIIEERENELKKQEEEKLKEELKLKQSQEAAKKKEEKKVLLGTFKTTAYDLSEDSCGKVVGSKGYGVTASGFNLSGLSWADAMTVAADTRILKLGTKIYIEFEKDDPRSKYNGIYTVRDRGGAIKGKKLDIFLGDFQMKSTSQKVKDFGRSTCKVYLVN